MIMDDTSKRKTKKKTKKAPHCTQRRRILSTFLNMMMDIKVTTYDTSKQKVNKLPGSQ